MLPELLWSELAFLSLIELHESLDEPFTLAVAEMGVVCLWLDDPTTRAPGEIPDEAAERRLFAVGRERLASYRDPSSPSFGEGVEKTARVVESLLKAGLVWVEGARLFLTPLGRAVVAAYLERKGRGNAS